MIRLKIGLEIRHDEVMRVCATEDKTVIVVVPSYRSVSRNLLYCIHTKKLSCLKSGVEFDMNDNLYEFKYLDHF